ncbi:GNAT family N-acetyltransferase [Myxococcus sp. RHSTA-1-4]|uniref:GNAT family N-acetyltransferase n=1 Tax=Myxococcus sp. RHSTA-1-4 TaxID=2874601 RepID=UPI001CBD9196|nr:GNAT family N-acetyltransferase [Myxococcus sp. RHSTA-1-4]MBZ4419338.1 GNAT family N-acetyltransferase [Myxococcus sp. RHSTA-1-4]
MDRVPSAAPHIPFIRRAEGRDIAALAALYQSLVPDNPRIRVLPERVEGLRSDPASLLIVAEVAGEVRGTVFVTLCADVMFGERPYAVLENFVVAPAARGQGLGTRLLSHAEALCREHACTKMMLLSAVGRTDAHRLFERLGFRGDLSRGFKKYLGRG